MCGHMFTSQATMSENVMTNSRIRVLDEDWDNLDLKEKVKYSEKLLEAVLQPYISQAIEDYYGEIRLYQDFKITHIQGSASGYQLTVEVETYVGAHKPPYGFETMTIEIASGITVTDYQHENKQE